MPWQYPKFRPKKKVHSTHPIFRCFSRAAANRTHGETEAVFSKKLHTSFGVELL